MKKGRKTVNFDDSLVNPKPSFEFNENPVMIHEVIVSGITLVTVFVPFMLKMKKIFLAQRKRFGMLTFCKKN